MLMYRQECVSIIFTLQVANITIMENWIELKRNEMKRIETIELQSLKSCFLFYWIRSFIELKWFLKSFPLNLNHFLLFTCIFHFLSQHLSISHLVSLYSCNLFHSLIMLCYLHHALLYLDHQIMTLSLTITNLSI